MSAPIGIEPQYVLLDIPEGYFGANNLSADQSELTNSKIEVGQKCIYVFEIVGLHQLNRQLSEARIPCIGCLTT